MDVIPKSNGGMEFLHLLGRVTKSHAAVAKDVLTSANWNEFKKGQHTVKILSTQVRVEEVDWMPIMACLNSYRQYEDVMTALFELIARQITSRGIENAFTGLSHEKSLEIIQALAVVLEEYPRNRELNSSGVCFLDLLYLYRKEDILGATERFKEHMTIAIKFLANFQNIERIDGVVGALRLIIRINTFSNTTLIALTESSEMDVIKIILDIQLRHREGWNVQTFCSELLGIVLRIRRTGVRLLHMQSPTPVDLILGYMKISPGHKAIHDIACSQLDLLVTYNTARITLTHDILLFVSNIIRDQQMKMNGLEYNSQQYALWKFVDAGIGAIDSYIVSKELYDALHTSFSITFLLRTLVFFMSTAKVHPSMSYKENRETTEIIHRVCKLIRFRIRFESDNACEKTSLQRLIDNNGVSVLMDTIYHQSGQVVQELNISTVFVCVNILLQVFEKNDGAQEKYLVEPLVSQPRALMQFAFGKHMPIRKTQNLPHFIASNFVETNLIIDNLCDHEYIRGISDTIKLLWVFSSGGALFCKAMLNSMNQTAVQLGKAFTQWNLDMNQAHSRVKQQDDIIELLNGIVWHFDQVWIRTLENGDNSYFSFPHCPKALKRYLRATKRFRQSKKETHALMKQLETRIYSVVSGHIIL
jgi:hypothetical protein